MGSIRSQHNPNGCKGPRTLIDDGNFAPNSHNKIPDSVEKIPDKAEPIVRKLQSQVEEKYRCSLFPFERVDCLSMQEAKQKSGWSITAFDLPDVWKFSKGEGVKIAVLDTGCDLDHPDLKNNLLKGMNFVKPGTPPEDDNGHGCVSPDCIVHTNYSGIDEIESLYDSIDVEEIEKKSKEGSYCVKDVSSFDIQTYSFDSDSQQTSIGKISSIQKLPINNNVVCVELEGGIKYKLTPWHPVYLLKNKHHDVYEVVRKRADEITVGDPFIYPKGNLSGNLVNDDTKIVLPKKFSCYNCGHIPKFWKNDSPTRCKKCLKFDWLESFEEFEITTDLAWLCGIVLTDGHISKNRLEVTSITKEILLRVQSICENHKWTTQLEEKRIIVYGKEACNYMVSMGIKQGNKSISQDLPIWVGMSNAEVTSAFIAGIVDGDGSISVSNTKNRVTTASYQFARKFCALLNSMGISSGVSKPQFDKRNRKIKSKHPTYKVTHQSLTYEIRQHLSHPEKIKRSKVEPSYQRKTRRVKSIHVERHEGYFYDFTVEKYHNYIAEGHFVSNTHIIGTLVAENNDIGIVGICPESKVIPIKVLDGSGNGNLLNVAKGIIWAADHGCDIISMSLGAPVQVKKVQEAIQYAAKKGIPTFVAAGNAGNTKEVYYPANYPETIAIGAVDADFRRADFSNTGDNLDFMAPGVDIFSTVPDNWYATLSGTSMATPFAVGVASLVLSYIKHKESKIKLSNVQDYRDVFKEHTIPINNGNYRDKKFYQGFGIIDPRKMMKAI